MLSSPAPTQRLSKSSSPIQRHAAPILAAKHVTAGYGGTRVLAPLTCTIEAPSLVAIVGPNGAGKSTLLKLVTGALTPWSGRLTLFGGSVEAARRAGAIAYMPQHEQLDWDFPLTVHDVVMSGRLAAIRSRGGWRAVLPMALQPAQDAAAAAEALRAVHMTDYSHRPIGTLSGGQKKRVLLARALAQNAALLMLDEPLAGVDRKSETVIRTLLSAERDRGRTILVVLHDLDGLEGFADRVLVINTGLVADGVPEELFDERVLARARVVGVDAALGSRMAKRMAHGPAEAP
jgi:manganese/iron transport system ATP-binding protein